MTSKATPTTPVGHAREAVRLRAVLTLVLVILVTGTLGICIAATREFFSNGKVAVGLLAAGWAIGAPAWFWFEYFFIYKPAEEAGQKRGDDWERFKYGQQVCIAIWAGVSASLGVYAASSALDHAPKLKCELTAEMPGSAASGANKGPITLSCS